MSSRPPGYPARSRGHRTFVRVATWNVEWAVPGSPRGRGVAGLLERLGADVLCVTEGHAELLPAGGHVIDGGEDWGYPIREGRRKVLLWSREPWHEVDRGSADLPPGRFVRGVTDTLSGAMDVAGLCIPWRDAHVRTGRCGGTRPWDEHRRYLGALAPLLAEGREPTVVTGDFNQRIPRRGAPADVARLLDEAFVGFRIATAGTPAPVGAALIDHIALSPGLAARRVWSWCRWGEDGRAMSDHHGVGVDLARAGT